MNKPFAFGSVLSVILALFFLHAPVTSCNKTKTDTVVKTVTDTIRSTVVDTFNLPVNLDSGLVAYYPLNGNISDSTGHGNNAQAFGNLQYSTDSSGHAGGAALFNGGSYILVSDNGDLSPTSFSISVQYFENSTTHQNLISKINYNSAALSPCWGIAPYGGGSNPQSTGFTVLGPGVVCGQPDPIVAQNLVYTNDSIYPGRWYQLVCTFDAGVEKIYLNGYLKGSMIMPFKTPKQCVDAQLAIGAWFSGSPLYFSGKMDEIRFYNRALNIHEIKTLAKAF